MLLTDSQWAIVAAIAAILGAVPVWVSFVAPAIYRYRLRRPFVAGFTDKQLSKPNPIRTEISATRDTEIEVIVRVSPTLNFDQTQLQVCFVGPPNNRPAIIREINPVSDVLQGQRHANKFDGWTIINPQRYTCGNTYITGFIVRTRAPGRFHMRYIFFTEAGESNPRTELYLNVL